ncbi:MAG: outer membrane protein assembly factor BamE [Alphaproteobacteria bacterium]|nr:outer membrane protein assembly factor BamE [Alphaproteobacteria bacterium]MCB9975478.1 outer membrane protein assembly factor BamE [Rhodospirillales bacterium]
MNVAIGLCMVHSGKFLIFLLICVAGLGACAPVKAKRGNMLENHQLQQVVEGQSTRSDVLRAMGSPTTVSTFNQNVWYYIGQDTEKRGILDAEVVNERIVAVVFNGDGIVERLEDIEPGREDVPIARAKTPTHGNDLTFTQQLLGNLGRFNPPSDK